MNKVTVLTSGQDFAPSLYSDVPGVFEVPYLTGASCIDSENIATAQRWTNNPRCIVHEGDILIVCKGSGSGKVALCGEHKAHIARQFMSPRPINAKLDPSFLFFYCQRLSKELAQKATGLIEGIDRSSFLSSRIAFPSIQDQLKISGLMRIIDERITVQNKIIEGLRSLEIALRSMAEQRFDGQSVLLSSLFDVVKEKARNRVKATVYTASSKYGLIDEESFFKKKISSENTENYTVIRKGDYVFSKSSSKDAPFGAFLCFTGDLGLVSPLYYVLRPKDNFSPTTMRLWFASSFCQKQMDSVCQEGARNHGMLNISLKDFLNLKTWKSMPRGLE